MNSFSGIINPLVYEKASKVRTLANDGGQTIKFELLNNTIFSGKTTVKNGKFRFSFIVPRDIDYTYGTGKISYYAYNSSLDMGGYYSDIIVGGFSNTDIVDTTGPEIKLYMNDTLFRNGGMTDRDPRIFAIVRNTWLCLFILTSFSFMYAQREESLFPVSQVARRRSPLCQAGGRMRLGV